MQEFSEILFTKYEWNVDIENVQEHYFCSKIDQLNKYKTPCILIRSNITIVKEFTKPLLFRNCLETVYQTLRSLKKAFELC